MFQQLKVIYFESADIGRTAFESVLKLLQQKISNFFILPVLKIFLNPLMPCGNKISYILEQTLSFKVRACSSMYHFLLALNIIG